MVVAIVAVLNWDPNSQLSLSRQVYLFSARLRFGALRRFYFPFTRTIHLAYVQSRAWALFT